MTENSTNYSKICYKKNFLTKVIARVDFLNSIERLKTELPVNISNIVKSNFPIAEPKNTIIKEKNILTAGTEKIQITEAIEWIFHGKDREKKIVIIPNAIFIQDFQYDKFEQLRKEFQEVLKVFLDEFQDTQVIRLGLRYVNEIKIEEEKPLLWDSYLNNDLLSLFKFSKSEVLSRIFSTLELNYDDFYLRYNFGMSNPDFPAPIKKKIFVLDFDAYYQGVQNFNEIIQNVDKYHNKIQELFEKSITENLRKILYE